MAVGKFFIPSLTGFNSLTKPSFKSCCMYVTGFKNFESSYCVLQSPKRSDEKFSWMFCLVLRNSLSIKSLFLGSVIFRNDIISYILYFSNTVFNTIFFNMALNTVLNMSSSGNSYRISIK